MRGFRVYDKIKKVMISTPSEANLFLAGNGNIVDIVHIDFYLMDRYVRMDSIGLLDKQRKEIYEGDIVAFDRDGKDYWKELYEIRYSPYRACWQLFLLRRSNHGNSPQYISNAFTQGEADTIEVIGNIKENPELVGGLT